MALERPDGGTATSADTDTQNDGGGRLRRDRNPYPDGTLKHLLYKVGFRKNRLDMAYAIAMAESGGRANAHNGNENTGDNSYGLFQINMLGEMGPDRRERYGLSSNEDLFDPETNARIAYQMSNGGRNWTPWSTYNTGAFQPYYGGDENAPVARGGGSGGGGGGYSGGGGGDVSYQQDKLDMHELAAEAGWSYAFLMSKPELKKVFQEAIANGWSPAKFVSKVRDTDWFQENSATARAYLINKETDPATWQQDRAAMAASVMDQARAMGAPINNRQAAGIAENAMMFGWQPGDSNMTNALSEYVKRVKGSFVGQAGVTEDSLAAYANSMGVRVSKDWTRKAVQNIAAGDWDEGRAQDYIRRIAMSAFPTFRDDLQQHPDMTLADLASPYMQSYSAILEKNPAEVDLFDPTIRRALTQRTPDGKPAAQSLWDFETSLRKDPRWLETKNGTEEIMSGARQVLSDFGFEW